MNLTDEQRDVLSELVNIGVGQASSTLNEMIGHHIRLQVPSVKMIHESALGNHIGSADALGLFSSVYMGFQGDFDGRAMLVFPQKSANILVSSLLGEGSDDGMNELKSGTLVEVGNILINGVMGSMANMLGASLRYTVPDYLECEAMNLVKGESEDGCLLLAEASFVIDDLRVQGNILLFFQVTSFERLLACVEQELAA